MVHKLQNQKPAQASCNAMCGVEHENKTMAYLYYLVTTIKPSSVGSVANE